MPTPSTSRLASMGHAARGVWHLFFTQPNAKIHAAATLVAVWLGHWLDIAPVEWALVALAIGLVLAAEALNTGIEYAVDLASPEWQALARNAKDTAAAGVLLASLAALGVGVAVFGPKIWG
jgi:diacylglycerol kinase